MEGNGVISNRDFLPMGIEGRRGRGRHRISGGDPLALEEVPVYQPVKV